MNIVRNSVSLCHFVRGFSRDSCLFPHLVRPVRSVESGCTHIFGNDSRNFNLEVSSLSRKAVFSLNSGSTRDQQYRGIRTNAFIRLSQKSDPDEEFAGRGEKILKLKLNTTRLDAVIKAGLGMSKNKIEKVLYDDRVRVNGTRPKKKSECVYEGDEIDIVRGYNKLNSDFIDVSRVEILELVDPKDRDPDDDDYDEDEKNPRIPAKLRRSRLLTIKNYSPPWKGTDMEN